MTPSSFRRAGATTHVWMLVLSLALLAWGLSVVTRDAAPAVAAGGSLTSLDLSSTELQAPATGPAGGGAGDQPAPPTQPEAAPEAEAPAAAAPEPPAPPAPAELAPGEVERIALVPTEERLAPFAGLSTWVDLYDTGTAPEEQVAVAAAGGVEAMFVQTARFNSPSHLHDAGRLGRLVESAHDAGMRVMVWYIPDFADLQRDYRRAQHAMAFVTPRGDRPDAFGLDIETEHVTDTAERSRRLLALSGALRTWVGPDYPMAAIVLPPLQLDLRPSWWPDFPYAELTASFDVFVPMSYSSFRGLDAGTTYDWNARNVAELRVRAGDADLPVHLAGGLAADLDEVGAFVAAAGDSAVLGAGLYDLQTTPARTWAALRPLRAGP